MKKKILILFDNTTLRIFELMKVTLPYKILESQYKLLNNYVIVMNARKEAVVSIILPNKTIQSTLCI